MVIINYEIDDILSNYYIFSYFLPDGLDQYTKKSNITLRNVDLPDEVDQNESQNYVEKIVMRVLKDEFKMLAPVIDDIDTGFVKTANGRKT